MGEEAGEIDRRDIEDTVWARTVDVAKGRRIGEHTMGTAAAVLELVTEATEARAEAGRVCAGALAAERMLRRNSGAVDMAG